MRLLSLDYHWPKILPDFLKNRDYWTLNSDFGLLSGSDSDSVHSSEILQVHECIYMIDMIRIIIWLQVTLPTTFVILSSSRIRTARVWPPRWYFLSTHDILISWILIFLSLLVLSWLLQLSNSTTGSRFLQSDLVCSVIYFSTFRLMQECFLSRYMAI